MYQPRSQTPKTRFGQLLLVTMPDSAPITATFYTSEGEKTTVLDGSRRKMIVKSDRVSKLTPVEAR